MDIVSLLKQMHDWQTEIASQNIFAFTMDIDWASEAAIAGTVDYFISQEIPLTIYCTHPSPYLEQNLGHPLLHQGIHPNFAPDSSQGQTPAAVVEYLRRLRPDAITMRCHRWSSSNDIYELLAKAGILFDSNQISLMDILPPYIHRSGLLSFPVFWEDGAWLWHDLPLDYRATGSSIFAQKGLKVINFHPMHFALNTPYFRWMRELKDSLARGEYNAFSGAAIEARKWRGNGIRDFLLAMIDEARKNNANLALLSDLYFSSPVVSERI